MRGVLLWVMCPQVAWSTTWTVDSADPSASPDISSAIDMASSGDRIEVVAGLYTECVNTDGKDLELEGVSGSALTSIEGSEDCDSTWIVDDGETVQITGFTIRHDTGRALWLSQSQVFLDDLVVSTSGLSTMDGGGAKIY